MEFVTETMLEKTGGYCINIDMCCVEKNCYLIVDLS
jgi:hypothetical protein